MPMTYRAARRYEDCLGRAVRRYQVLRQHGHPQDAARALAEIDQLLDQYADALLRATEWDADRWGFDRWMESERAALLAAADGQTYPQEVI